MSMEIEKYKDALKRAIKKINELDERLAEEKGKILKSAKNLKINDVIDLKFCDGEKQANIM